MSSGQRATDVLELVEGQLLSDSRTCYIAVVSVPGQPDGFHVEVGWAATDMPAASIRDQAGGPLDLSAIPDARGRATVVLDDTPVTFVPSARARAVACRCETRPARAGCSVGRANGGTTGTLGAAVRLTNGGFDDRRYFLSAWHCLHAGIGTKGDELVQPSALDSTSPVPTRIGELYDWPELSERLDVAIGVANNPDDLTTPDCCNSPGIEGVTSASVQMKVFKCGRGTDKTSGRIRSVKATVPVELLPGREWVFRDQIMTSLMLDDGDSGAVLIETDSLNAVGMAVVTTDAVSFFNHMTDIVAATGVIV